MKKLALGTHIYIKLYILSHYEYFTVFNKSENFNIFIINITRADKIDQIYIVLFLECCNQLFQSNKICYLFMNVTFFSKYIYLCRYKKLDLILMIN